MSRALALALLLACHASPALAWELYTTDAGVPLHWGTDAPTWAVASGDGPDGLTAEGTAAIAERAFAPWAGLPCRPLTFVGQGVQPCQGEDDADGYNCVFWVLDAQDWQYRGQFQLATTALHFDTLTGEIRDADIAINGAGFAFNTAEACVPGEPDLQMALTHEAGHFVGLAHSAVKEATMYAKSSADDCPKRVLADDDLAGFCGLYETLATVEIPGGGGGGGDGCAGGGGAAPLAWAAGLLLALAGRRRGGRLLLTPPRNRGGRLLLTPPRNRAGGLLCTPARKRAGGLLCTPARKRAGVLSTRAIG